MAILTLQRRLREAGRIRIGAQVKANGKTRPSKLEAFRLTSSDKTAIWAAAELYGGDPHVWDGAPVGTVYELFTDATALPVVVPPAASAFSQYMEAWTGGGCARRCDGVVELLSDSPCLCENESEPLCKPTTRLSVILRDLPGLGVWRLESHGYYAATELAGTVEVCVQAATRGQLLPAVLRLEQRQVKRPGEATRSFAVPVLDIQVKPEDLGLVVGSTVPALAPVGPSGETWQPIAAPVADEPPADVGEAIRRGGTDGPKRRKNSAPELPPTGLNPRGAPEPATGTPLTDGQMRKLRALYNDVGIDDGAEQKHTTAALLGLDHLATHKNLTPDQASSLIDILSAVDSGFLEFTVDDDLHVIGVHQAEPAPFIDSEAT